MIPSHCLAVLSRHRDEVWLVKFSPSGLKIASIGKDCVLYLWSISKAPGLSKANQYKIKCSHEIRGHAKQVNALNWSHDESELVVTASADKTVKIWDSKTGRLVLDIHDRHQEAIVSAIFIPGTSGIRLLTAAVDKLVIIWELTTVPGTTRDGYPLYQAEEIARIETRNYLDASASLTRLVLMG